MKKSGHGFLNLKPSPMPYQGGCRCLLQMVEIHLRTRNTLCDSLLICGVVSLLGLPFLKDLKSMIQIYPNIGTCYSRDNHTLAPIVPNMAMMQQPLENGRAPAPDQQRCESPWKNTSPPSRPTRLGLHEHQPARSVSQTIDLSVTGFSVKRWKFLPRVCMLTSAVAYTQFLYVFVGYLDSRI